jgi:5'-nucleotidase
MAKKILFVDMDNVLVDFASGISRISDEERSQYKDDLDEVPGIFSKMDPLEGAVESYKLLAEHFDTYILSTAPWENSSAWSDKLEWVKKYLGGEKGDPAYKRLILSHNKNLCHGDYLIDDRDANGADKFGGELLRFGKGQAYPDWKAVVAYLLPDHA